jgi:predicted Rossmann fold flavoprotein
MQLAASLGHCLIPPVPSLFSFTLPDPRIDGLAGLSVPHARLKLLDENGKMPRLAGVEQEGPLLVTHWGLSGPAVLRLSAWGARWLHERQYHAGLTVNWLGKPLESVQQKLREQRTASSRYKIDARSPFPDLPFRLWQQLCTAASVRPEQNWADLSKAQLAGLAGELSAGRYNIQGKGQFKDEFVTCGGVDLDEVDFHTLRSRLVPGLYFAGEILDIDGLTGGFNFQSAWTTAWLAAQALAGG